MKTKICFRCGAEKSLDEYYVHPKMGDGHLGKCKSCTKSDSKKRETELRKKPEWAESEKKRAREKYFRLGYKDLHKPTPFERKEINRRWNEKFPEKVKAKSNSPKSIKGKHNHHWSYNSLYWKDCISLTEHEHNKLHRYMIYDQERMMYRTINGVLLDTKEKHIEYFESLKNKD